MPRASASRLWPTGPAPRGGVVPPGGQVCAPSVCASGGGARAARGREGQDGALGARGAPRLTLSLTRAGRTSPDPIPNQSGAHLTRAALELGREGTQPPERGVLLVK